MVDKIDWWLVGLAGATSGAAAASVNIAARYATDPGDVLGFYGGAIGAGLAVAGALGIERWKATATASKMVRMSGESLTLLYKGTLAPLDLTNYRRRARTTFQSYTFALERLRAVNTDNTYFQVMATVFDQNSVDIIAQLTRVIQSENTNADVEALEIEMLNSVFRQIRHSIDFIAEEDGEIVSTGFWPRHVTGLLAKYREQLAMSDDQSSTAGSSKLA